MRPFEAFAGKLGIVLAYGDDVVALPDAGLIVPFVKVYDGVVLGGFVVVTTVVQYPDALVRVEGLEVFDKLLSINVPWSQEFSGVLRF